ncbi:tail fiber assembly protein [Xenorhabdus bovienii]|uniref:tail fiber assembly protein n=1 Tax=Xenorhabdus bovienii TaxID=40576 RepID=UPI0023B30ADB|nr:tail fiber assembly protein [Xenorhabdus bovienii]MDE9552544.1 tail fiber assembly protein [Xenorhabdus bovienii]
MSYFYSAKTNSFYPTILKQDYISANSWPDDGMEVTEDVYHEFNRQLEGKHRVAGDDGFPKWVDIPPPTIEKLQRQAKIQKYQLMNKAKENIELLQDAIDLGMATEIDKLRFNEWRKYRVMLNRVDALLPNNIQWPRVP